MTRARLSYYTLALLVYAIAVYLADLELRHTLEPIALEPRCTEWRIYHPDPRRKLRIVNDCHPLDTTFVPR